VRRDPVSRAGLQPGPRLPEGARHGCPLPTPFRSAPASRPRHRPIPGPGKVVLITGASSGIGEAAARRLAAAGHPVVLGARRTERVAAVAKEIEAAGGTAVAHELDVTVLDSVRAFVAAGRERFGRVDVLVNNAGVMPLSPLDALKVDEWDRMIDVNLRGGACTGSPPCCR